MKTRKPPAVAIWLVEHLNSKDWKEVLAGDLLEQFNQGRSNAWYWRQVLVVILLVVLKDWRFLALAAVVTGGWAYPLNFWDTPMTRIIFGLGNRSALLPLIYATASPTALAILPTCFSFGMYTATKVSRGLAVQTGRRILRRMILAQFASYLTVATSMFLFLALLPVQLRPTVVVNMVGLLPVFLGILVMIWASPWYNVCDGTSKIS